LAAHKGHLDVVRVLIEHRADLNIRNNDGSTPILVMAPEGHVNVVRVLSVEYVVDVNISDHDGVTPSCIAAINGHADIVRALVEHRAINGATAGRSPVIATAAHGHLYIISLLYTLGASMAPPAALANEGGGGRSTETTSRTAVDVAEGMGTKGLPCSLKAYCVNCR
jgi:ankyrin repeat protein